MLAATGSTITAATWPGLASKRERTEAASLYRAVSVSAAISAGTPAESGAPPVRAPEPALTSMESEWPW